jgi:tetratricopeptide (TPR) repeat protein
MFNDLNHWLDLCEAAEKRRNYAEVLRAGDEIARLAPDKPQSHHIRGLALHRLDRIEEAIEAYRRVLALDPDYLDALMNLGECCQFLNRIDEAETTYRRAIEVSGQTTSGDDFGLHYWNLALVELLKGDLRSGFLHYPARFKAIARKQRPDFPQPLWRGEDLRGKSILVTVDQGHGDTLMMARYLPLLRERGGRAILQAQTALVPYLKNWDGADQVIEAGRGPLPAFDVHAWEFDLPRLFGTTLETVPAKIPYLPVLPPDEATCLPDNGKKKIGVCWAGNPSHPNDKRRSIPLADFMPLFAVEGAEFFSLNRDMRKGDAELLAQTPAIDLAPRLADFAATARFINQLDLVITCDTALAHLAGGMGKPVWILLPFAPSWHWMLAREDSPWYPSARLFRQKTRGDWGEPVKLVAALTQQKIRQ